MFVMSSLMDMRRPLLLLTLLVLTQTMPTNRSKRELLNSEEAESAEILDSPVKPGPSPEDDSQENAGNDIVVDAPTDFGQPGNAFTLSLHDDVSNVTTDLVTLVFTEEVNGQSSAEGPRESAALGTKSSQTTGPGSVSNSQESVEVSLSIVTTGQATELAGPLSQEGNSIQTGVSSESASQENAETSLQGVSTDLSTVSSSASVSVEQSSDSSQVSSESSSSSASVSTELTSYGTEVSSKSQSPNTGPASSSQESAEASLQSLTPDLQLDPSAAPTEGPQPDPTTTAQEEEADEDDVDEDDVDEDDDEEIEPSVPTSPPSPVSPTGSAVDASLAPELKDPYSGGVSGELMLADQPMDMQAGTGVNDDKNNILNVDAALLQFYSGGIDEKNNIVSQTLDLPAAPINQEGVEASLQSVTPDLQSDASAAPATQAPQPDATTAAAEEEGDEDEADEDEVDEDDEEETGGEVTPSIVAPEVSPTISDSPSDPAFPTGNAADASVAPSGLSVDVAVAPQLKDPCTDPGCGLNYDPLLDTEGYVGDDPQSYTVDQLEPQNIHTDTLKDKQTLADTPADLTSELNSAPESLSVSTKALVSVEVASDSLQSGPETQSLNTDTETAPINKEGVKTSQSDASAAPATQSPQPDPTTAAPEEEGDDDEVDEDEVDEDDEDETVEVTVAPTISASPPVPVFPTGNAADTSVAPSGLSVDVAVAPQLKDPCTDPGCGLNYDPLLDTEGYVGDDPQSYTVDQLEPASQNTQTDTFTDKQTLTEAPADLTSELNSAPESLSVKALVSVEVASDSLQSGPETQSLNTDTETAPINQEGVKTSQSDASAAPATQAPQPDATTAAAEEEGDEDEVDEDEVEEDDEDETGEVTVAPPVPVFPTGNAADASVATSGLSVDVAVAPQLKDPCTDPGCGLNAVYDPLLDTEGYVGDDPQSYTVDQLEPQNIHTDTLKDKQTLADTPAELTSELNSAPESLSVSTVSQSLNTDTETAPINQEGVKTSQSDASAAPATQAPQPDATTAAAEEEGDEDEVDEDEVEEDDEDETGGEVTPSIVTPEVSPTISASPSLPVLPAGNAVDSSVPPSGIAVDTAVASQLKDPLMDTEGYMGDDPLSYTVDQLEPASQNTQTDTLTDKQTLPDTPAELTLDLNSIPGLLDISSTAPASLEILVLPSNIIQVSIEFESPNTGPGPASSSQESAEASLQSLTPDLQLDPSAAPATQAPQPDPTTAAAEQEGDEDEDDDDEDDAVAVNPSAVSLQANLLSEASVSVEAPSDSSQVSAEASLSTSASAVLTLNGDAPVSVEAPSDSSQISPSSDSVSVELRSLEVSADSAQLQLSSDPSVAAPATTGPQLTTASPEEDDADDDDEDEDETGGATQAPQALVQAEPLSVSSSASVSVEAPADISQISSDTLLSSAAVSVELPLNSTKTSPEVIPPNAVLVSVSIEASSALSAPNSPSAPQTGPGAVVMDAAPTSSEERLAEQEKAEIAPNGDVQGNPELAISNPWTEFLHSLGTRTPQHTPQDTPQQHAAQSSSEED